MLHVPVTLLGSCMNADVFKQPFSSLGLSVSRGQPPEWETLKRCGQQRAAHQDHAGSNSVDGLQELNCGLSTQMQSPCRRKLLALQQDGWRDAALLLSASALPLSGPFSLLFDLFCFFRVFCCCFSCGEPSSPSPHSPSPACGACSKRLASKAKSIAQIWQVNTAQRGKGWDVSCR